MLTAKPGPQEERSSRGSWDLHGLDGVECPAPTGDPAPGGRRFSRGAATAAAHSGKRLMRVDEAELRRTGELISWPTYTEVASEAGIN